MALRLISALALLTLAAIGQCQAFGRFGYKQSAEVPGFKIDRSGFVDGDPLADRIRFAVPSSIWKPIETTETEQVVIMSGAKGCPEKASFNLAALGFSLYFPTGIDFRLKSTGPPYLSWEQGSVSEDVPTPEMKWFVLSFPDKQPPIVFGFPDAQVSLTISGAPGDWSIKSPPGYKGWMRVCLPQGLEPALAVTAGGLGRVARTAAANAGLWKAPPPKLVKTDIDSDIYSVTATWHFDQPGAVVPPPAVLANLGKYLLQIKTPTRRLPGWNELGPIDVVVGDALTVRFPVRRIPTGRALTCGAEAVEPIGTASTVDLPSVVDLALSSLVGSRDNQTRKAAEDTVSEYLNQANFFQEPWTRQQLPYDAAGNGIDLAAAHALLMQANTSSTQSTSESNSILTSVSWRQDWLTWRVWVDDPKVAQRTGALAAITGALCPEPERRLAAGMFQAGLSGNRGLDVWKRREGMIPAEPKQIEPLYGLRKGIFGLEGPVESGEEFALSLLSPLRIFSNQAVTVVKQGPDLVLQWFGQEPKPTVIVLASAFPIDATPQLNLHSFSVQQALGFTELHFVPEITGPCEAKITIPDFGKAPPDSMPIPTYSEPIR